MRFSSPSKPQLQGNKVGLETCTSVKALYTGMPCRTRALRIVKVSDKVQRANATWNRNFGSLRPYFS